MKPFLPAYYSAGAGPAVVLLHCTLSSKNQWKALSGILERDHRVIAVDLYGYGETPMPEKTEGFTLTDEVELVQSLLDSILLPDEPFHLVGHSYGGAVALHFCHQRPGRILSLAIFEPVAFHLLDREDPGLEQVLAMKRELARLLAAGLKAEAAATFLDYWSGPGSFANFPARVQKDFARRTPKLALDFQALTGTPLTLDDYRALRLPVTLIAGRSSRLPALRVADELSRVLPDCRLRLVDTGHMGPLTHPELVNPIIKASLPAR
jgi:pimeloyl-ACP methyl ester carboxylesterase